MKTDDIEWNSIVFHIACRWKQIKLRLEKSEKCSMFVDCFSWLVNDWRDGPFKMVRGLNGYLTSCKAHCLPILWGSQSINCIREISNCFTWKEVIIYGPSWLLYWCYQVGKGVAIFFQWILQNNLHLYISQPNKWHIKSASSPHSYPRIYIVIMFQTYSICNLKWIVFYRILKYGLRCWLPHCFLVTALVRHSIFKFTKENKGMRQYRHIPLCDWHHMYTVLSLQKHW